jgi:hypothetical protein
MVQSERTPGYKFVEPATDVACLTDVRLGIKMSACQNVIVQWILMKESK